jgi:hypothetical protein
MFFLYIDQVQFIAHSAVDLQEALLATNFVAVPVITQPMGPESQVINVYMRTLCLRETYMGHYKNANPDIEVDARIRPVTFTLKSKVSIFCCK